MDHGIFKKDTFVSILCNIWPFHRWSKSNSCFIFQVDQSYLAIWLIALSWRTFESSSQLVSTLTWENSVARVSPLWDTLYIYIVVVDTCWELEKWLEKMMSQNNSKKNALKMETAVQESKLSSWTNTAEVKMVKLWTKWTRKYLLNPTANGFSKALKLRE